MAESSYRSAIPLETEAKPGNNFDGHGVELPGRPGLPLENHRSRSSINRHGRLPDFVLRNCLARVRRFPLSFVKKGGIVSGVLRGLSVQHRTLAECSARQCTPLNSAAPGRKRKTCRFDPARPPRAFRHLRFFQPFLNSTSQGRVAGPVGIDGRHLVAQRRDRISRSAHKLDRSAVSIGRDCRVGAGKKGETDPWGCGSKG